MTPLVPLLFAAPKYLRGELTLGEVTQLAAAFAHVQMAISWIVDNFSRVADWYASARRVMDMVDACASIDGRLAAAPRRIEIVHSPTEGLTLDGVSVNDPTAGPIVARADLTLPPATSLSISGDTSSGKTTLVRAIAGLWHGGHGVIRIGSGARIMIAPQQGYVPLTTLREALSYPGEGAAHDSRAIRSALADAGLAHLADKLDQAGPLGPVAVDRRAPAPVDRAPGSSSPRRRHPRRRPDGARRDGTRGTARTAQGAGAGGRDPQRRAVAAIRSRREPFRGAGAT